MYKRRDSHAHLLCRALSIQKQAAIHRVENDFLVDKLKVESKLGLRCMYTYVGRRATAA